ncbi:MAG TPA: IreB family regulatory phosphoprotein [Limnochordales bacterium]
MSGVREANPTPHQERPDLDDDATVRFRVEEPGRRRAAQVLRQVYQALVEKGYHPTSQLVGYLLSGDPTYITSHKNARSLIRTVERDELLEEIIEHYVRCPENRPT